MTLSVMGPLYPDRITENLNPQSFVPAAGQGALAIETRVGDATASSLLSAIHDEDTFCAVSAERAFLAELGGGCSIPAGAFAEISGADIQLIGMFASVSDGRVQRVKLTGSRKDPIQLCNRCAAALPN